MRITVRPDIVIHASSSRVFARLTDIEKWPLWGGNVVSAKHISVGSLQAGSQIRQVTKGGRKPGESILEVTDYVPAQSFGFRGPNLNGTFTLEPVEAGTRLHTRFEVEAAGLAAIMYRLLLTRFVRDDLKRLRKLVESEQGKRG